MSGFRGPKVGGGKCGGKFGDGTPQSGASNDHNKMTATIWFYTERAVFVSESPADKP